MSHPKTFSGSIQPDLSNSDWYSWFQLHPNIQNFFKFPCFFMTLDRASGQIWVPVSGGECRRRRWIQLQRLHCPLNIYICYTIHRESGKPSQISSDLKSHLRSGEKVIRPPTQKWRNISSQSRNPRGPEVFFYLARLTWIASNWGIALARQAIRETLLTTSSFLPSSVNEWSSWGCWSACERLKWAIRDH